MFYAAFPPEFNSGRMYSGAGSGSIARRRSGLGRAGREIQSTVGAYSSVIESLISGPWAGPSSMAMLAAVTPYLSWMQAAGAHGRRSRSPGHRGGNRL